MTHNKAMSSFPRSITIIRHGEKPTPHNQDTGINEQGQPHADSLTPRGWQRAGALAARLGGPPAPAAPFERPDVLYTCGYPDDPGGSHHRPYETLLPLSRRLGLPLQVPLLKTQGAELVSHFVRPDKGKAVLVCWEHKNIPPLAQALASALGIASEALPPAAQHWPGEDYHSALIFRPAAGQERAGQWEAVQLSQQLLDGDD